MTRSLALFLGLTALGVSSLACSPDAEQGSGAAAVKVARAYVASLQSGDSAQVLAFLSESTRTSLEAAAQKASDHVGGRRSIEAHEMLQVVDVDRRRGVTKSVLVDSGEDWAKVALTDTEGQVLELELRREEGKWRVVVPVPATAAVEP